MMPDLVESCLAGRLAGWDKACLWGPAEWLALFAWSFVWSTLNGRVLFVYWRAMFGSRRAAGGPSPATQVQAPGGGRRAAVRAARWPAGARGAGRDGGAQ
jgi:hypothetical protein